MIRIHEQPDRFQHRSKAIVLAIFLLTLGTLLILRNYDLLDQQVENILFSWPMILVAIGLLNLNRKSIIFPFFMIALGGFFLVTNYFNYPIEVKAILWPAILIFIGLSLLTSSFKFKRHQKYTISNSTENHLDEVAIFGGGDRVVSSQSFRGGDVISVFGGSKIDLSQAKLAPGTHELNVISVFGGSDFLIPEHWHIKVEVLSIFGTFKDRRITSNIDYDATLIIKGVNLFGGGHIS